MTATAQNIIECFSREWEGFKERPRHFHSLNLLLIVSCLLCTCCQSSALAGVIVFTLGMRVFVGSPKYPSSTSALSPSSRQEIIAWQNIFRSGQVGHGSKQLDSCGCIAQFPIKSPAHSACGCTCPSRMA